MISWKNKKQSIVSRSSAGQSIKQGHSLYVRSCGYVNC